MAPGTTVATYPFQVKKLQCMEGPSPDGQDHDRGMHQSRDQSKKSQSPSKHPAQDLSTGRSRSQEPSSNQGRGCSASLHPSDKDTDKGHSHSRLKSKTASAMKENEVLKAKSKESEWTGPSHKHWPALLTASVATGMKWGPLVQSQSKKDEAKVARRLSVQQQAGQQQATCIYLPSTLTSMKPFQTSTRNVASLAQECDHLDREARVSTELYTVMGDQGQKLPVLLQPVQASVGATAEEVLRIQLQELHLRNARPRIRDQALAQNLIIFNKWEKDHEMKKQGENREVVTLADMISGASPLVPIPKAAELQSDANMDITEKGDGKAEEGNVAKKAGNSAGTDKDAKMT